VNLQATAFFVLFGNCSDMPGQFHAASRMVMDSPAAPRRSSWSVHAPSPAVSLRYSSRAAAMTADASEAASSGLFPAPKARSRMALMSAMAVPKSPPDSASASARSSIKPVKCTTGTLKYSFPLNRLQSGRAPGLIHALRPSPPPERLMKNAKSSLNAN